MKTFKDLDFKAHSVSGKHAIYHFDNKYGVSVICGHMFYSNGVDTYELAILYNGQITYNTDITNDVIGNLTADQVTDVMIKVQQFLPHY